MKIFRDPVHNVIDLDTGDAMVNDLIIQLINSKEFQRLRFIKQLGFTNYAFPGATHTRFEHSLGVAFLAKRFVEKIISMKSNITGRYQNEPSQRKKFLCFFDEIEKNKGLIIVSALLHDIGHGPFSHVFEGFTKIPHERWTEWIVTGNTEINRILIDANAEYPKKIYDLLEKSNAQLSPSKILTSQLDVDRMDYILRDSLMTGAGYGKFDIEWMINVLMVGITNDNHVKIGFDEGKGLCVAEDFVMARIYMYKNVYLHKTSRAVQEMLLLLLSRIRELVQGGDTSLYLDENLKAIILSAPGKAKEILPAYVNLTDCDLIYHMKKWESAEDEIVKELSGGILNRRVFKQADPKDRDEVQLFIAEQKGTECCGYYSATIKANTKKEKLIYRRDDGSILLFDKHGGGQELSSKSKIAGTILMEEDLPEEYYVHTSLYDQFLQRRDNR